ncbi:EmrB/QacA subfamily drug resistance transporter [Ottowia thiooxydans]|uniref:EmrB/QacA subfamily drug resistance transporter n=1 Tax=Ottowia thiooxydans TaxID=219182 RepID=A0ABV2Q4H9_9BURK
MPTNPLTEVNSDAIRYRIVPLIVACPLFLQNLDTSVMATALPSIAESMQVPVLDLNLAIASYVISLAIFLPASAWLSNRFGARRVFCAAVIVFSIGSALCGMAQTLAQLIVFRLLQGAGGSMMVPVGRSILLRCIPPDRMVSAMVWFTIPGAIGRMMGPFFGGAIVTVASWHWIFLVNIPFGILGVVLAMMFIDADEKLAPESAGSMDFLGLAMLGTALLGLLGGLELSGKHLLPPALVAAMIVVGTVALCLYVIHCRRHSNPILDFSVLRFPIFRVSVLGGLPVRIAVIGAVPFLLPLLFQIGLGMSPLKSGLITMCIALGSLTTRAVLTYVIGRFGFRTLLIAASLIMACLIASYGLFAASTPVWLICGLLFLGGLATSMVMVTLNTVAYSDVPRARASHATAMASMTQQLAIALGVVIGAWAVTFSGHIRHPATEGLQASDFAIVFVGVALLSAWSALSFRTLKSDDGSELRQQRTGT